MKNILFNLLLCCAFALSTQIANAQTAADEAAVKSFWKEVWQAYETGDINKVLPYYTDQAQEIGPDGRMLTGKAQLRENWEGFMKMLDAKPAFTSSEPNIRFITPDVVLITSDTQADIKMGGQQVGGKTKDSVLLHKIKGRWYVEFDSMTPVMEMPAPPTSGN